MKLNYIIHGKLLNPILARMIPDIGLILIAGGIGSGKSTLAYAILEYKHLINFKREIYVYGFPKEKIKLLPSWIKPIDTIEFPDNSIVLVDEAYIQFHSRTSGSKENKFIDLFSGLVRQKNILGIFISQTFRKLDIGILTSAQLVLIKKPPLLQAKMDRSEIRTILSEVIKEYQNAKEQGFDPHKCVYTISNDYDYMGMIYNSNGLPSFWTESISKVWGGVRLQSKLK